jgi:hypothetical protein
MKTTKTTNATNRLLIAFDEWKDFMFIEVLSPNSGSLRLCGKN